MGLYLTLDNEYRLLNQLEEPMILRERLYNMRYEQDNISVRKSREMRPTTEEPMR